MKNTLQDSVNVKSAELLAITDGGDTESTVETVDNAQPEEALKVRNELLAKSPNLSDTVMVNATVNEELLPAVMLKQVLAENPQAAKSGKVNNALNSRYNLLPDYMIAEIMQGKDTLSEKELLENKILDNITKRENIISAQISYLLNDTLNMLNDSIETVLLSENTINRKYQLISYYLTSGETNKVMPVLNSISQNFELSARQQIEYDAMQQFLNVVISLQNENKDYFAMSNEQKQIIETLAQDSTNRAGMQSRAVLSLVDKVEYPSIIPSYQQGNKSLKNHKNILPETFNVYPEYADDYFVVEYALHEEENTEDVKISLFDTKGKEVKKFDVKQPANQLLSECKDLEEGIYWVRKYNRNLQTAEKRIIIVRGDADLQKSKKAFLLSGKSCEIFPNPAKDFFTVRFNTEISEQGKTLLFTDGLGRIIEQKQVKNSFGEIKILTNNLKSGVYYIKLGKITEKVVIQ